VAANGSASGIAHQQRSGTLSERSALDLICRHFPPSPPGQVWIGDDAASVPGDDGPLLLTSDTVVAGVHADLSLTSLEDLGWKALAGAVSDIAAMGGAVRFALVSLAAPRGTSPEALDELASGIAAAGTYHGCPVVGGDLANTLEGDLVVSVAVIGSAGGGEPVLRSGARPGDAIYVTGRFGAAAAGLASLSAAGEEGGEALRCLREHPPALLEPLIRAHARPVARLAEGEAARAGGASAMMDSSDGLAASLDALALASSVGISLDLLAVAPGASEHQALHGGEDYELVFSVPRERETAMLTEFARRGLAEPVRVGTATADAGERLLNGAPFEVSGYEHGFGLG